MTGLFNQAHSVRSHPTDRCGPPIQTTMSIHKFSPDGKRLMTLGKKGDTGDDTSKDSFNRPNAVAFGPPAISTCPTATSTRASCSSGATANSSGSSAARRAPRPARSRFPTAWPSIAGPHHRRRQRQQAAVDILEGRAVPQEPGGAKPGRAGGHADGTIYVSDVNAGAVTVFKNDQIVDVIKVEGRPHGLRVDPETGDVYTSSSNGDSPNVTKASIKKPGAAPAK